MSNIKGFYYFDVFNLSFSVFAQFKKFEDIRVRDSFIYADNSTKTYYLYAQTANRLVEKDTIKGVEVYKSKNLSDLTDPTTVFRLQKIIGVNSKFELLKCNFTKGKYYLFVSFTGD